MAVNGYERYGLHCVGAHVLHTHRLSVTEHLLWTIFELLVICWGKCVKNSRERCNIIGMEKLKEEKNGGGGGALGVYYVFFCFTFVFSCPSTTIKLRSLTSDQRKESNNNNKKEFSIPVVKFRGEHPHEEGVQITGGIDHMILFDGFYGKPWNHHWPWCNVEVVESSTTGTPFNRVRQFQLTR